jgi:hypothetical protein
MEYLSGEALSLLVPAKREMRCFEMVGDSKYLANRRRRLGGDGEGTATQPRETHTMDDLAATFDAHV